MRRVNQWFLGVGLYGNSKNFTGRLDEELLMERGHTLPRSQDECVYRMEQGSCLDLENFFPDSGELNCRYRSVGGGGITLPAHYFSAGTRAGTYANIQPLRALIPRSFRV